MKYLIGSVGLIGFLALGAPTLFWGFEIAKAEDARNNGERAALGALMEEPGLLKWWRDQAKVSETFNSSYLSNRRIVRIETDVAFDTLLAEAEEAPEEVFKPVYAAARAPEFFAGFCPELLGTLATKCEVGPTSSRILNKNGDEVARLSAYLRFVPNDEIGELPQNDGAKIIDLRANLTPKLEAPFFSPARRAALEEAQSLCATLRALVGNCVISRVTLKPALLGRDDPLPMLDARTTLTVMVDPSEHTESDLQDFLDTVIAATAL